jgi:heptosyltransferase-2
MVHWWLLNKEEDEMSAREMSIPDAKPRLLIMKTGAAGDVLRTTPLLRAFETWSIDWFVAPENKDLLDESRLNRILTGPGHLNGDVYDLVINLEDDPAINKEVLPRVRYSKIFGAFMRGDGSLGYTADAGPWFDMGLMSRFGIKRADEYKLANRFSYQEIIFRALGLTFKGERYILPRQDSHSEIRGDIAVAPIAGNRWPNKNWKFYDELARLLSKSYRITILPHRRTLHEHIADIREHSFMISNDSLPMHISLGAGIPCLAIFTCTSPWEIYDYGILTKVVSPHLAKYFYARTFDEEAVTAISLEEVYRKVCEQLD